MKNTLKLSCILFFFTTLISAQDVKFEGVDFENLNLDQEKNYSFKESLRFGGGIGLSFGNDFFSGSLSPFVLSQINEYISAGVGLNFTYSSFRNQESFIYGGSLIAIGHPIPEIQASAEFEQLRVNRKIDTPNGTFEDDYWYPALFLGLGYNAGPVTFGVRWDVLYDDDKSIYANAFMPFVRVFF